MNTDERELRDAVIGTLQHGGPDCVTDVMINAMIELVHSAERDTAARMRDKCVGKALAEAQRERELGATSNLIRAMAFESLASELESLTLDQVEEKQ